MRRIYPKKLSDGPMSSAPTDVSRVERPARAGPKETVNPREEAQARSPVTYMS